MDIYETELNNILDLLIENGITHSIFRDIFLQDLREYRKKQLESKNLQAVFPLWQIPADELINQFM